MLHCQGCHRPDGSGVPGAVPDLRGHVSVFLGSPAGRAFLVRVPGSANAPLSDRELAELLNWMVGRFDPAHVPPTSRPTPRPKSRRSRAQKLSKVKDERAAILAGLTSEDRAASPPRELEPPSGTGDPDRRSQAPKEDRIVSECADQPLSVASAAALAGDRSASPARSSFAGLDVAVGRNEHRRLRRGRPGLSGLKEGFELVAAHGPVAMVITVSNACPVAPR